MATVNLDTLRTTQKRERIHNAQVVVKLPSQVKDVLEAEAKQLGVSSASVYRQALAEYLERRGYQA